MHPPAAAAPRLECTPPSESRPMRCSVPARALGSTHFHPASLNRSPAGRGEQGAACEAASSGRQAGAQSRRRQARRPRLPRRASASPTHPPTYPSPAPCPHTWRPGPQSAPPPARCAPPAWWNRREAARRTRGGMAGRIAAAPDPNSSRPPPPRPPAPTSLLPMSASEGRPTAVPCARSRRQRRGPAAARPSSAGVVAQCTALY